MKPRLNTDYREFNSFEIDSRCLANAGVPQLPSIQLTQEQLDRLPKDKPAKVLFRIERIETIAVLRDHFNFTTLEALTIARIMQKFPTASMSSDTCDQLVKIAAVLFGTDSKPLAL